MKEAEFLNSNEQKVNIQVAKIMLYTIFAFPVVYLLYFIGVFSTKLYKYNISFGITTLLFVTPWLLIKLGYNRKFLKYHIITAIVISMSFTYSFITPEDILLLWLYPISISCLYFDKKVAKYSLLVTVIGFFCAQYIVNTHGAYRGITDPLRAYLVGSLPKGIELTVLSLVYISLAKRTRNLLESLYEKTVEINKYSKNLENMVAERTIKLEKANEDLKEADKLKSQFFANVSHELRTPLTLALAPLESMLQGEYGEFSGEQRKFLNIMHHNCLKLLRLINNLLDFSKLEARKMTLQVSKLDLALIVDNIIASSYGLSQKRNIEVTFRKPENTTEIYLDLDKTEKIITNLLSNALKFTRPGGKISFELLENEDTMTLVVADTGIGIQKKDLPYIFDRFRQVEGSLSREYEGTGIGLSLVKEFVELMKGSIKVESIYGCGTTFYIEFRKGKKHFSEVEMAEGNSEQVQMGSEGNKNTYFIDNGDEAAAADETVQNSEVEEEIVVPKPDCESILLVDDNRDIIVFLKTLLQDSYNVYTAQNGLEALEVVMQNKIDLVISDIMMPKMSGYELLKVIRSNEHTKDISVILLSAKSEISEKIEGLETGADDYVTKPFNSRELTARVKTQLKLRSIMTKLNESKSALENLLNNAGQGFLKFGRNMVVDPEYSTECINIFGEDIGGKSFAELLYSDDSQQRSFYEKLIASIYNEKSSKTEVYMSLLPQELMINGRYMQLEHKLIGKSDIEDGKAVMVVLTDMTNRKLLEKQMESEKNRLKMVVKAVVQYNDLKECLNDFYDFCSNGLDNIYYKYSKPDEILFEIFRNVHTYKGVFSQFEMNNTVVVLHSHEDRLILLKNKLGELSSEDIRNEIESLNLVKCLDKDIEIIRNTLGSQYLNQEKVYYIEETRLRQIEDRLRELIPAQEYERFIKEIRKIRYRSIKEVLNGYSDYIIKASERLGKSVDRINISGEDMLLDYTTYKELLKAILHIFRNSLDHGIELPDERIIAGKDEKGNINCDIIHDKNKLYLTISDDGRGMDIEEIKAKATEKGLILAENSERLSEQDIMKFIFNDSFSTKRDADELSGRGMGLSAVKHAVETLRGTIEVASEKGKGTRFHISIPNIN